MPDFSKVESLENWIAWKYLREELLWSPPKIAYELGVNERLLMEWVNASGATMTRLAGKQPEKVREIYEVLRKKHPIAQAVDQEMPNIDIKKAASLLNQGFTMQEIAKKLKVDYNRFRFWWQENLRLINEEIKKGITNEAIVQ